MFGKKKVETTNEIESIKKKKKVFSKKMKKQ